ncbi:inverted formin-2-like [Triticum dicoccoides]|uniref:inverted formin-2-like n=1 Tax=Triticum dicoccoides TaxID=85692 RepID=UPI001891B10D|nr:inverted formin-2-like [Triticum dicoccoides]
MGKPVDVELGGAGGLAIAGGGGGGGGWGCGFAGAVGRSVSFRCVFVLALAVGVLVPALFLLLPSRPKGYLSSDPDVLAAEIQVGFTLEKPVSFLAAHMDRIGSDIFEEIGVPNSKVSIVSMHSLASKYSTRVVFGVLPYPKDASISLPALSVLRSSLIGMMLKQLNLSLTPSIFGYPSSIELLGFPGGITVVPVQSGSIWTSTDPLFNFVLNNSIGQILGNLTELKNQLEFGLNLRSYERIYLQFRNEIGSSVEAPATIEASVLDGTSILLPYRLKQLAELIKEPDARNLGLNHSVFGKVKGVQLSSYLQHSISDLSPSPAPSPSPYPSPSPSPSTSVPPSLSPSGSVPYLTPPTSSPSPRASPPLPNHPPCFPCSDCNPFPPAGRPMLKPPCFGSGPKLPPFVHSPQPSAVPSPPVHKPYLPPAFPPIPGRVDPPHPLPSPNHVPNAVPGPTYQMMPIPSPPVPHFLHPIPPRKKRSGTTTKSPPIAPSPYSLLHS